MQGHHFRTWKELQQLNRKDHPVMSQAIWCDRGQHAFSSNDDERQHFTQSRVIKMSGNPLENRTQVTVEVDICGKCFAENNPFDPAPKDPVNALETESDAYSNGYDAGVEHALKRLQPPPGDTNWNSGSGGKTQTMPKAPYAKDIYPGGN